jgi:hypothetical protein
MVRKAFCLFLLLTIGAHVLAANAVNEHPAADLVFRNGAVYTVDAARSWASDVAVTGNRIVYVGTDDGVQPFVGAVTRVVDLRGRMLLPGFQDSHVHPSGGGIDMTRIQLNGVYDRSEVFLLLGEYAGAHPDQEWIVGSGWEADAFKPSGAPDRYMLDEIVPDRPAYLTFSGTHAAWVNSRALEIAGITAATPDPQNGIIARDENGEPTGLLIDSAQGLVERHIPPLTDQQRVAALRLALTEMTRLGITAIIDASTSDETEADYATVTANGELKLRTVFCQRYVPEGDDEQQVQEFLSRREQFRGTALRATCIKIGNDGIIEQRTGALLAPYSDRPDLVYEPHVEATRLQQLVTRLDEEGFQVQIHAIGDRAVRESLDAFEAARETNGARDSRHHLSHVQLIDPADIPRLRPLGVTANMTPFWAKGDDWTAIYNVRHLGLDRAKRVYQHRMLLQAGARLSWGTDWSVTTLRPLDGLEVAVTRRHLGGVDPYGKTDEPWAPAEIITLAEAIAAYTISGAYLSFDEMERGSIELGKLADLVVLEKNLFDVPELEIHSVGTDMTVFDGRIVYETP